MKTTFSNLTFAKEIIFKIRNQRKTFGLRSLGALLFLICFNAHASSTDCYVDYFGNTHCQTIDA